MRTHLIRAVATATMILLLTVPGFAQAPKTVSTLDDIITRGELRLCVSPGFLPFVGHGSGAREIQDHVEAPLEQDPSGVVGFDIELVRALAASLHVRLSVVRAEGLEDMQRMLDAGLVDIAASGLTRTLDRALDFYLSDPYFVSGLIILVPNASPYRTLADLDGPGHTVLVKPESTSEVFARAQLPNAHIEAIAHEPTFARRLAGGGCAAVVDAVKARSFRLAGLLNDEFRRLEGRRFTDEYFGLVLGRDEPFLHYVNLFLSEFKRSGRFHELASRFNAWFQAGDWHE